jgi:hypothetical protein
MNGTLNYAARPVRNRKAVTCGIVSAGIATVVFALPLLITGGLDLLQAIYSRPGRLLIPDQIGLTIALLPTLAMVLLPVMGLLFAGLSVAVNRRDYECAMIGFVVNVGGLIAGVGAVLLH